MFVSCTGLLIGRYAGNGSFGFFFFYPGSRWMNKVFGDGWLRALCNVLVTPWVDNKQLGLYECALK